MLLHYTDLISTLDLSTRAYNVLKREGIETINDLFNCPKDDMLKFKNFGKKSVDEIFTIIDELNENRAFIYSEINIKPHQQIKTFVDSDGSKYNDILVEDLRLSVRAINCLKSAGINHYSDLLLKNNSELIDIPNMGVGTLLELEDAKNNTKLIRYRDIDVNNYNNSESICNSIFKEIKEKFNINPVKLFEHLIPVCTEYIKDKAIDTDISIYLKDKELLKRLYAIDYVQDILGDYILDIIKDNIYGYECYELLEKMPVYFDSIEFVDILFAKLLSENEIKKLDSDKYIINYASLIIGAKKILTEKEYEVLIKRVQGKTLEEIGRSVNLTRERIRQIEAKALRRLDKNNSLFHEDFYSDIFKRYSISYEDFIIAFKNFEIYNYLSLRYSLSKGANDLRLPLEKILEDKDVPVYLKRACEKAIYNNYVKIANEYVPCTRNDISNYVLRTFASDEITFDEFRELYFSILEDIGKRNDPKLVLMGRGYENKLAASMVVLWKYGKKLRYYNMELQDFTELLNTLDLNQYNNIEYSTLKFFRLYPELMKTYDLRDEYELHNLLKKICNKDIYLNINFKRMPHIELGEVDRDTQVRDLLLLLVPVSNYDFAIEYEREYGVSANTVSANYMSNFNQYLYNGVYKIDLPDLPNILNQKLKQELTDDFYLLSTIRKIYKDAFPTSDEKLLNPSSLTKIGFKVYSNYVIKDKFNSATEYFNYILTNEDIIYYDKISSEIKGIMLFTTQFYKLKADYEIIEFSPNKFINIRRLQQNNITKKILRNYCKDVLNFVGGNKYFTNSSLNKEGFSHELDDFGFDELFYTSILVEDKSNISYHRIGGNKLMISGDFNILFKDFLEFIVYAEDSLFIDIYELSAHLQEYYNITISIWRLIEIIRNSTMFYDVISEKVFADYDIYYAEV